MDADTAITLSALKFISGESNHVCRLCFALTENQEFCLEDSVKLDRPYYNDTISYLAMFEELGINMDRVLPNTLCLDCVATTINSFLFHKLCQYSQEKWIDVLNVIGEALSHPDMGKDNIRTAFLIINKNKSSVISSRSSNAVSTKSAAVQRIKNIMASRTKTKQKIKTAICDECGVRCKSNTLAKHMKSHNKIMSTNIPCPQCSKYFSTKLQLEEHSERVHYPKIIQCSQCAKKFGTEKMLKRHIQINHTAAICKLCFVQFPSKSALKTHLDKHEVNKCPQCDKSFLNRQTFKLHLKICGIEATPSFFCDICGKGYARKNGLRTHLKTLHGFGKVFSCSWCNKKYDAVSKLRNHIVKHTRERNFHCEHCGGRFVTRAALVYHIRLHTGERPYPCDLCEESFLSASRRMEHKRVKHFGPTKECNVCHVKFVTTYQLKKHVQRHYNPQSKLFVSDNIWTVYQ